MNSKYVDDFKSPWSKTFRAMKNVISIFNCQSCENSENIIQASECCGRYFCRKCLGLDCRGCHCKLKVDGEVDLSYPVELCSKLLALLDMQFEIDSLASSVETREANLDFKIAESSGMDNDGGDIKYSQTNAEMTDVTHVSKNTTEISGGDDDDEMNENVNKSGDDNDHVNLMPSSQKSSKSFPGCLKTNVGKISNLKFMNPTNTFIKKSKEQNQRKRKIKLKEIEQDYLERDRGKEDEISNMPKRRKHEDEVTMEMQADQPIVEGVTSPNIRSIAESLLMLEPSLLSAKDSQDGIETPKIVATPLKPSNLSGDSSAFLTPSSDCKPSTVRLSRRGRPTRNMSSGRTSKTTPSVTTRTLDSFFQYKSPEVSIQSETPARRGQTAKNDSGNQPSTPKAPDDKKQPMGSRVKKVDVIKRNKKGETALHIACIKGNMEQVRQCLEEGMDPNLRDNANWTPLHEASNKGFHEIVELLLDRGADVNALGMNSCTPLHDAVTNERMECVKVLLDKGADINIRNEQGLPAVDCTEKSDILQLFKKHSEKISKAGNVERAAKQLLKFNQPERIIITTTGLDKTKKLWLVGAINKLGWTLDDNITEEVTHVITSTNENKICQRTLKYMLAVVMRKWIVTMDWLKACGTKCGWVSEEEFIVSGCSSRPDITTPYQAKLHAQTQVPGIFKGCNFYIPPSISSNTLRLELSSLIKFGSGEILLREPKVSEVDVQMMDKNLSSASLPSSIPFHASPDSPFASCSFFIVQDSLPEKLSYKMVNKKLCRVTTSWLYDCISLLTIVR